MRSAMPAAASLDDRYLAFRKATAAVFARFPQAEPLRHRIFKDLWVQRRGATGMDWLKCHARRFLAPSFSPAGLGRADVLLWVDGNRDVICGAILPVWEQCRRRGLRVCLAALGGGGGLPPEAFRIEQTPGVAVPEWAGGAWQAFLGVLPELNDPGLARAFRVACASAEGLRQMATLILAAVEPRIVLIASNNISGGTAVAAQARAEGRCTVLLQHGVPQAFYTPVNEDLMFIWGQSSAWTLAQLQVPASKLRLVGSPRHDTMVPVPDGGRRLRQALGLPERPVFVFFSNGNDLVRNGGAPAESAAWLEAAARAIPEVSFVVRLHPNEDGSLYREAPHVRVTKTEVDLETTLSGADVVASICSTVMYDALLFGRPVWQFSAPHWPVLADNVAQGLAEPISSCQRLQDRLRAWLTGGNGDDRWQEAVRRVFTNRGNSAAAVAEQIEAVLRGEASLPPAVPARGGGDPVPRV